MNFGVCDFSRLAVTDWRLCFVALMTGTPFDQAVFLPFKWKYIVIILWFFMCRNMYLELFKIHIFYQKIQNFCRKFAGKGNGRNWCLCVAVQKSGDWEEWRSMSDLNKSSSLRDFEKADHVNHLASNEEIGKGWKERPHTIFVFTLMEERIWGKVGVETRAAGSLFWDCLLQWNLDYTSKSGLKNLDVELRGTYKWK